MLKARWHWRSDGLIVALGVGLVVGAADLAWADEPTPAHGQLLDLNRATAQDFETLPHVGTKRAGAILALRARLGRFRRVEELLRVRGIGRATFRRLRGLVTVSEGHTPQGTAGREAQRPAVQRRKAQAATGPPCNSPRPPLL